jgi:hypothetical protein
MFFYRNLIMTLTFCSKYNTQLLWHMFNNITFISCAFRHSVCSSPLILFTHSSTKWRSTALYTGRSSLRLTAGPFVCRVLDVICLACPIQPQAVSIQEQLHGVMRANANLVRSPLWRPGGRGGVVVLGVFVITKAMQMIWFITFMKPLPSCLYNIQ